MSINSALLAGVSGLVANSSALAAISDNISNVNTIGFKSSSVDFEDVLSRETFPGAAAVYETITPRRGQLRRSTSIAWPMPPATHIDSRP